MTTEYRPLLTVEEVIAALRAGDAIECENDGSGWIPSGVAEDSDIAWLFSLGIRYRARPAGESVNVEARSMGDYMDYTTQAAEIEALRASNDAKERDWHNAIRRAEAAEARAARLEVDAARYANALNRIDHWLSRYDVGIDEAQGTLDRIRCEHDAARFPFDAARSAVSGGGNPDA